MKIYHLRRVQLLPISPEKAWEFFSSPRNLSIITPSHMNFKIVSMTGEKMFAGQEISYKVNVLPLVRMSWTTRITEVSEQDYFIDTQLAGPYTLWHHKHIFKKVENGVEMTDELDYAVPLGLLGRFANWLFVQREVNAIFDYRNNVLKTYFTNKAS